VRIVGGEFGGRRLLGPRSDAIRPSSDRLRQTLFDILTHGYGDAVREARVLDLFAGTGALGLEALSRGARHALFVEEDAAARGLIRGNIESLGLTGRTRIFRRDATRLGEGGTIPPFDLAFADPPYGHGFGEKALCAALSGRWLKPGAMAVLEERGDVTVTAIPGFEVLERRDVGDSQLVFLKRL
jgi:16S rRNA (guanine966-N2)-methyltransferase